MCPDVPRLRVDSENGLEAGAETWQWRTVPRGQEVVVLEPIREGPEVATMPSRLQ